MSDTVKIPRPRFVRSKRGPNGRAVHDDRGNAIWVRTRATDAVAPPEGAELSLVEDSPSLPARRAPRARKPR